MGHDTWLLEQQPGSWLLEDGGKWLLEEQSGIGLHVEATHPTSALIPPQKKKQKPVVTELTIKLMSDLITSISVNIPSIKLLPLGIFTEKLRQAFVIPITANLKEKVIKYLKEEIKIMKYETFLEKYGEFGILALVKKLLWKK